MTCVQRETALVRDKRAARRPPHLEQQEAVAQLVGAHLGHELGGLPVARARVVQAPRQQHVGVRPPAQTRTHAGLRHIS